MGDNIDIEKYLSTEMYEEYVQMKCIKCDYEEMVEYEIACETMYYMKEKYPILDCVKCSKKRTNGEMVPIDIFNKLKQ